MNLLRRYHGGAAYDSSIENTAYAMRADQMRDEKQRIAEAIAAQIPDNASLFINIGTTTESIARALLNHNNLKIITKQPARSVDPQHQGRFRSVDCRRQCPP